MKKLILVCSLVILVLPAAAGASPFLVCDWQEGVAASEVEINGVVRAGTVVKSGPDMLLLDLAGFANGVYTFRARFIGEGGWPSDWSAPFDAVKPEGTGSVLRIKK